jgi:hypothetical protein
MVIVFASDERKLRYARGCVSSDASHSEQLTQSCLIASLVVCGPNGIQPASYPVRLWAFASPLPN